MGDGGVYLVRIMLSRLDYLSQFIILYPSADSLPIAVSAEVFKYSVLMPSFEFSVDLAIDIISVVKQMPASIPCLRLSIAHDAFLWLIPVELTIIEE